CILIKQCSWDFPQKLNPTPPKRCTDPRCVAIEDVWSGKLNSSKRCHNFYQYVCDSYPQQANYNLEKLFFKAKSLVMLHLRIHSVLMMYPKPRESIINRGHYIPVALDFYRHCVDNFERKVTADTKT